MTRLALKEDHTTTGGRVLGGSSDFYAEDGRPFALDGDKATCGNCKGLWPILGSAHDWMDDGRSMVKDLDPVHCPCGKNRVFASGSSPFDYETGGGSAGASSTASEAQSALEKSAPPAIYDEQVRAAAPGIALAGYPYLIEKADGETFAGRVIEGGLLSRIATDGAGEYTVYWGDDALERLSEQSA